MNTLLEHQLLPAFGKSFLNCLGSTMKWKIEDPHGFISSTDRKPYLMAFWHNRILMIAYIYSQFLAHREPKPLVSPSRDGQWITSLIGQFGYSAVRGSSSKNASLAFRRLLLEVKKGKCDIAITPDGPRGPVYRVQPGVLLLSQYTGRPIIPLTYHIQKKYELRSWDRFQIPHPYSEITVIFGTPRVINPDLRGDDLQPEIEWLQNALGK